MKNKFFTTLFIFVFFVSLGYGQNQDSIILPDITTEVNAEGFSFDSGAIPDFTVEPLKNIREETKEEIVLETSKVEEVPVLIEENIIEEVVEETEPEVDSLSFEVSLAGGYAKNMFAVSPGFAVVCDLDNISLYGAVNLSLGGLKTKNSEKKTFMAIEGLEGRIYFALPKDLVLMGMVGIKFFQCEKTSFSIPMAVKLRYERFLPFDFYLEIGQKPFLPFDNSFYGALGGNYFFKNCSLGAEAQFGKKIGLSGEVVFSTKPVIYDVYFKTEYIIGQTPYFSLGGTYRF